MMVCVAIYAVLVAGVAVADNLHTALWSVAAYTVILCFPCLRQVRCQNLSGMRTKGRNDMAISVQVPKDLSGIKTKVALNLTKRQIICFSGCGSSRDTLVFFNQGTDRNISRITSYDGSNASVLLLRCMRKTGFRRRRFCILCSGRRYSHRA